MNIAAALKAEITRVARKTLKAEAEALKKATAKHRSEITALKKEIAELKRQMKALPNSRLLKPKSNGENSKGEEEQPIRIRYNAKRLAAHRQKLGLSAESFGKLIGVSTPTIYGWEAEKSTPRSAQLPAIAAVMKMGKRQVIAALEAQD